MNLKADVTLAIKLLTGCFHRRLPFSSTVKRETEERSCKERRMRQPKAKDE